MSRKRKRETFPVNTELVEIYENLANPDEEIRFRAAQGLLVKVSSNAGFTDEQLNEILRRLVRGLCSGRKAARLGFSIALTEFLIQLQDFDTRSLQTPITISEVIEVLKKQTQISGSVSGQEERDHHFGRLFGAEAVIKSASLFKASVDIHYWSEVLDLILDLAKRKHWLREECGWIVCNTIESLGRDGYDYRYTQIVIDKYHANGLTKTPEGIALWLVSQSNFPQVKFPPGTWQNENPLHRKDRAKLAAILKDALSDIADHDGDSSKGPQKGNWIYKLHFAWEKVLTHILSSCNGISKEGSKDLNLTEFWDECVDKSLFASSSSEERKYWGFLLFQRAVCITPVPLFSLIFSTNLTRCLLNQLASPKRYLHRIAEKSAKAIFRRVQTDPVLAVTGLECFLSSLHGQINFDPMSKSKIIEKMLPLVKDEYLRDLVKVFRAIIFEPGTQDQRTATFKRQYIADQLSNLVRSRHTQHDSISTHSDTSMGIQGILSLFINFAYFIPMADLEPSVPLAHPPISDASRKMFRSRIYSCLTHLISKSANPPFFAYHVVSTIRMKEELNEGYVIAIDAYETVEPTVQEAWKVLTKIHLKEELSNTAKKPLLSAFKLLYSLTILQVYNFDADAVNLLQELKECYGTLVKHKNNNKAQGYSDILVEIILSLVAKPSLLFRLLGQQVFSAFVSKISRIGLESMVKVLTTEENISGQNEMFDCIGDDDDGGETSDTEEIHMTDVTAISAPARHNSNAGHDPDTEDGSFSETGNDESDLDCADVELAAFDAKLAEALGIRATAHTNDDESTDEDMNDEQMEALDQHLEKVFRERKKVTSKKLQWKEAKENILNFKNRVLDLLEIFIKQQPNSVLALDLLVPVLTVIRTTKSPLVSGKACDLMRKYSNLCKGKNLPGSVDKATIFRLLVEVHNQATKQGSNAYTSSCSQASLLLVRILGSQDRENLRRVLSVYSATQERALFDPKCKVKTSFFSDWLNFCSSNIK